MGIQPLCLPNESGIGYALRFAQRNGLQYLGSFLKSTRIQWLVKGTNYSKLVLGRLQELSHPNSLSEVFNPLFKNNRLLTARVCLDCIDEAKFVHLEVQNPFVVKCTKHNKGFIERCTHCDTALNWELGLLDGRCTNRDCGKRLVSPPGPEFPLELTEQQVSDCILASHFARNTYSTTIKVSTWPTFTSLEQEVNQGYKLLSDSETAKQWRSVMANSMPSCLPASFRNHGASMLVNAIGEWKNSQLLKADLPNTQQTSLSGKFMVSVPDANKLLTTNIKALKLLQEEGLIPHTHNRIHIGADVDLTLILSMLKQANTDVSLPQSLSELRGILDYYALDMVDVLLGMKCGVLHAKCIASVDLHHSIHVNADALKAFGQSRFTQFSPQNISFKKAMKLTGLSEQALKRLRKTGQLRPPRVWMHGGHEQCCFEDVLALRQQLESKQLVLWDNSAA